MSTETKEAVPVAQQEQTSSPVTPEAAPQNADVPESSTTPEINLADQLKPLIEYYLSKTYLATDPTLVQQMDSDLYVPVSLLLNFPSVQAITTDADYLANVMKTSTLVTVDQTGSKIKPNFKIRNTIILRDIPQTVDPEEVKTIFASSAVQIESLRPDIGDTWFVTFEDDDAALKALDFARKEVFQGKSVKARIKSENLLRSVYFKQDEESTTQPQPQEDDPNQSSYYPGTNFGYGGRGWGGRGNWIPRDYTTPQAINPYWSTEQGTNPYRSYEGKGRRPSRGRGGPKGEKKFSGEGRGKSYEGYQGSSERGKGRKGGRGGRKTFGTSPGSKMSTTPPQLGLLHFPPLVASGKSKVPSSGYSTDFIHYAKDDIIQIINDIEKIQEPTFTEDLSVLLKEPATKLLLANPDANLHELSGPAAPSAWKAKINAQAKTVSVKTTTTTGGRRNTKGKGQENSQAKGNTDKQAPAQKYQKKKNAADATPAPSASSGTSNVSPSSPATSSPTTPTYAQAASSPAAEKAVAGV
eukprot:TRINITY_DN2166_c0_g4_i1.p1 TRINITY_DN2166_c0_g4~~TRINITY_DN2166_c0_g4_i1.p1  ORF type:complete len:525 (-),score=167.97 TRINITY_DN2166_c0_g4_i1:62-1636(-)